MYIHRIITMYIHSRFKVEDSYKLRIKIVVLFHIIVLHSHTVRLIFLLSISI
jgi:hypothetical protein